MIDELMDVMMMLLLAASLKKIIQIKKRRPRRWWVRPEYQDRRKHGYFATLMKVMKEEDQDQFFTFTRMRLEQFQKLLKLVGPHIDKKKTRDILCPEERLLITLYYLSHGGSMQVVAWNFRIGRSTAMGVIKETCNVIWLVLANIYVIRPTEDDFRKIADGFFSKWNFPNCVGAVDGKHIRMQAPSKSGSEFYNYKKFFSLILMATCDADYKFTLVDIGSSGSLNDAGVFMDCAFGMALGNGTIKLPRDGNIINTNTEVPFCFLADEAFPLNRYIMRPFPGKGLYVKQLVFNYRLSRARRTIENAFGILASRWRVLQGCIVAEVDTVKIITGATVMCLHNFIMTEEEAYSMSKRVYATDEYVDNLSAYFPDFRLS